MGERTPEGVLRESLGRASGLLFEPAEEVVRRLGSGQRPLAADTVPFALWCADRHLASVEAALWAAVSGLGDRDMTCAIAGGVVAMAAPLPVGWLDRRESLPVLRLH